MLPQTTLATRASGSGAAAVVTNTTLNPYEGEWSFAQAAHLLRRTTFGPSKAAINQAIEQGLDATILQLFADTPLPDPPRYYDTDEDINVGPDESWVDAPYLQEVDLRGNRRRSVYAWTLEQMLQEGISLREKMVLFWINHFAVGTAVRDGKYHYRYVTLLRNFAWGNFRDLIKEITLNPSMLRFLNGNQNRASSPNENFARELLELFTVGKGETAGPGDYTNYTEDDVRALARALTGWRDRGYMSKDPEDPVRVEYNERWHDAEPKQLSHRFDDLVIEDMGEQEYLHVVDIIFQKEEVARFISRKLYRWFVYYDITPDVETNIIQPLAQLIIDNDYELQPALQTLLRSEHFFDTLALGPLIKNPLDFAIGLFKPVVREEPEGHHERYAVYNRLYGVIAGLEMEYFAVPLVAGWKAYYQAPLYNRSWINSTTLQARNTITNQWSRNGYTVQGNRYRFDPIGYIATFDNPIDPNALIAEATQLMLPIPLTDSQLTALKSVLIPGLPDFEWTVEYSEYLEEPDNENARRAVERKLQDLFKAIFQLAEFHLS